MGGAQFARRARPPARPRLTSSTRRRRSTTARAPAASTLTKWAAVSFSTEEQWCMAPSCAWKNGQCQDNSDEGNDCATRFRLVTSAPAACDGTRCTAATMPNRLLLRPDRWHGADVAEDVVGAGHLLPTCSNIVVEGGTCTACSDANLWSRHLPNRLLLRGGCGKCAACSLAVRPVRRSRARPPPASYFDEDHGADLSPTQCDVRREHLHAGHLQLATPAAPTAPAPPKTSSAPPPPRRRTARTSRSPAAPATAQLLDQLHVWPPATPGSRQQRPLQRLLIATVAGGICNFVQRRSTCTSATCNVAPPPAAPTATCTAEASTAAPSTEASTSPSSREASTLSGDRGVDGCACDLRHRVTCTKATQLRRRRLGDRGVDGVSGAEAVDGGAAAAVGLRLRPPRTFDLQPTVDVCAGD